MSGEPAGAYAQCEALVREGDHDAWLAALFVPAGLRPSIHALDAFFLEIRRVRDRVRQPLAGELRLQWWRDAIEGGARGDVAAHPVASALLDTLARHAVSGGSLIDAVETYRVALYAEAPATVAEFEDGFDRTIGGAIRSRAGILLGPSAAAEPVVRHAAVALGIADLLLYLSHDVARGFGVIPDAMLARHGAGQGDLAAGRDGGRGPAVAAVLADLRALARSHLSALRAARGAIPEAAGPAFLVVSLVEPLLRLSERAATDPLAGDLVLPQWRRHWILWRAARRGGAV